MNIKDFSVLAIKISGIILLALTVSKLPEYFEQYTTRVKYMPAVTIWHFIIPIIIPSIISILLIFFPYTVCNTIIFESNIHEESDLSYKNIEIIVIRILGLLLMNWAISHLVYIVSNIIMFSSSPEQEVPKIIFHYPGMLSSIAELIFSIWLLFEAKSISNFLRK